MYIYQELVRVVSVYCVYSSVVGQGFFQSVVLTDDYRLLCFTEETKPWTDEGEVLQQCQRKR